MYQGSRSSTRTTARTRPSTCVRLATGAAVVAISNDETGISEGIDVRFAVARIVERAADHGIGQDVVVDLLVTLIGALGQAVDRRSG